MPSNPTSSLGLMLRATTIEDHEEILKAANAAMKVSRSELGPHQTRVVALLKLDRFEDALQAISEGGAKLEAACALEKAYALYKIGKLEQAAQVAGSKSERSFKHVAAQVAYRAENFRDATRAYEELLANSSDAESEGSDIKINSIAAAAQLEWQTCSSLSGVQASWLNSEDNDGFELTYNLACGCISRGEFTEASALLRRAGHLCDVSDELSDDEKQAEMIPMLLQHAYVYSKLGKEKEAIELLKSLPLSRDNDAEILTIALNNTSVLGVDHNPFLALRKSRHNSSTKSKPRLFRYQERILERNALLQSLQAQKFGGVESQTKEILSEHHSPSISADTNNLSVVNSIASCQRKYGNISATKVHLLAEKRPTDVGLLLLAIQLRILENNSEAAVTALESFFAKLEDDGAPQWLEVRFSPGLVALAVSLYRLQGRNGSIKRELAKATSYWNLVDNPNVNSLLRGAGMELLKSFCDSDLSVPGQAFKKLCEQQSEPDQIAATGLVASIASSDRGKAQSFLSQLPGVGSLVAQTNVDDLLHAGVVSNLSGTNQTRKRGTDVLKGVEAQVKKRRRTKLPKNYEEGKKLDPERWLPLRDRSSYRPKGKKGKKKANESTQGGFVKEEETLELVGGAGAVRVEKAPATTSKKKKKGKK